VKKFQVNHHSETQGERLHAWQNAVIPNFAFQLVNIREFKRVWDENKKTSRTTSMTEW